MDNSNPRFTIILPTTGNREALLPYSIGSIQKQTVQDFEIFIIGDGVAAQSKSLINSLQKNDARIRFFDYPKHERRGEVYRHQALKEANGRFICYICDRDLWLPDHLETMGTILTDFNFASTTFINVREDQSLSTGQYIGYFGRASDSNHPNKIGISLSNAAHTVHLYNSLPHGWRTTPKGLYTDVYMWKQFLDHNKCRAYSHTKPTTLYFKRGHFPGISVSQRECELKIWSEKIQSPQAVKKLREEAQQGLLAEWSDLKMRSKTPILIKGRRLSELPAAIIQKVSNRLKRL